MLDDRRFHSLFHIDDHQGTSSEWFSSARKFRVAAAAMHGWPNKTDGRSGKVHRHGTPYSSAMFANLMSFEMRPNVARSG